jgi:hypothetical protein
MQSCNQIRRCTAEVRTTAIASSGRFPVRSTCHSLPRKSHCARSIQSTTVPGHDSMILTLMRSTSLGGCHLKSTHTAIKCRSSSHPRTPRSIVETSLLLSSAISNVCNGTEKAVVFLLLHTMGRHDQFFDVLAPSIEISIEQALTKTILH